MNGESAAPIRVMLAEDHALVREGIRMLLEAAGDIRVVGVVGDGKQAVALVEDLLPAVAILDITMPVMSGTEAAHCIHEAHPAVAVLMLSMHTGRQHIIEAMRVGALGYVVKSAAVGELIDAVREVAAGRRYISRQAEASVVELVMGGGHPDTGHEIDLISTREREVVGLLASGKTNPECAVILGVSVHTIDTHRRNIMVKLGFRNVVDLVKFAIRHGLADIDR